MRLLEEAVRRSASTAAQAKERWQAEYSEWQQRRIEDENADPWVRAVPDGTRNTSGNRLLT